jgi:hypothetical protein
MKNVLLATGLAAVLTMPIQAAPEIACTANLQQHVFVNDKKADVVISTPEGEYIDPQKFSALLAMHPKKISVYTCVMPEVTEKDLSPEELKEYTETLAPFLEDISNAQGPAKDKAKQNFDRAAKSYLRQLSDQLTPSVLPNAEDYFLHVVLNYLSKHETPGSVVETFLVEPKNQLILGYGVKPWLNTAIEGIAKVPREPQELEPENIGPRLEKTLGIRSLAQRYEANMLMTLGRNRERSMDEVVKLVEADKNFTLYMP